MKNTKQSVSMLVVILITLGLLAGLCSAADYPRLQIKGTIKYIVSEDTYGILGENNKKYQPVKQLPKEYRKDGTEVVVEARERRDIVAARMWGTAIEVLTITKAERFISYEDRQARAILLRRMEAFNAKDLGKLQQIDSMARSLTLEQFTAWLSGYSSYTLHYVETTRLDPQTITGFCLYSRQLENGLALSGNIQYSLMKFTLKQTANTWGFSDTQGYRPGDGVDADSYIQQLMTRSRIKFGTDNLANWKE